MIGENARCILALLMIPSFLYPKNWMAGQFVSIIAFVFFMCIHSNLVLDNQLLDLQFLLVQLLVLSKAVLFLVDSIIDD